MIRKLNLLKQRIILLDKDIDNQKVIIAHYWTKIQSPLIQIVFVLSITKLALSLVKKEGSLHKIATRSSLVISFVLGRVLFLKKAVTLLVNISGIGRLVSIGN